LAGSGVSASRARRGSHGTEDLVGAIVAVSLMAACADARYFRISLAIVFNCMFDVPS
jgi:hypothetical protein